MRSVRLLLVGCILFLFVGATHSQTDEGANRKISRNLITVSPMQFTESGFGYGFGYERIYGKAGIMAWSFPFAVTYNPTLVKEYRHRVQPMRYFMPGVKFYPFGTTGKVAYALGPSLVLAVGDCRYWSYGSWSYVPQSITGVIINNSVNMNVARRVYAGAELGLGYTYRRVFGDGLIYENIMLAQFAFKLGYRF